ncbi:hypothetical protein GcM1_225035 [Golovinomyces cichoracearum]|uniref:Uncharacterized protein n=1 Tax=Golovinomyces cichoracearum TaxID=62708 RepID=A0A420IQ71_9PEZI|nr:hypothetical protein GcM1_225035 [Golovinomyces cichoracearum]
MVGVEKWFQVDIDTIFWLKYELGWSEPSITDFVARYCQNHKNVKVAGIRYVLRSRRPSAGIPDSPGGLKALQFAKYQMQSNQADFSSFCVDNQCGDFLQGGLQQKLENHDINVSSLHSQRKRESNYQRDSWSMSENSATFSDSMEHNPVLGSRTWEHNDPENFSVYGASQTPKFIQQETKIDLAFKNDNKENIFYPFEIQSEGQKQIVHHQASQNVPDSNNQTDSIITDSIASSSLSSLSLSFDSNLHGLKSDESQLSFGYNPTEITHNKNLLMEQPQPERLPEVFHDPLGKYIWNNSLKSGEQTDHSELVSLDPRLSSHPGSFSDEGLHCNSYHLFSLMNQGENFDCECLESGQKEPYCSKSKLLPNGRVGKRKKSQSRLRSSNRMDHQGSVKRNKFGGTRGSPVDELQKSTEIDFSFFIDPLCDARLYEEDFLVGDLRYSETDNPQNAISPDVERKFRVATPLPNPIGANSKLQKAELSGKDKSSMTTTDSSTINLHNPEFYQPFVLPLDSRTWIVDEVGLNNFKLYSDTPTGRVIVNMFNPKFHSGFSINNNFGPSPCSPELLHLLKREKQLRKGEGEMAGLIIVESKKDADIDDGLFATNSHNVLAHS